MTIRIKVQFVTLNFQNINVYYNCDTPTDEEQIKKW
jgi:hypothetical protein